MIKSTTCCDLCGAEVLPETATKITVRLIGTRWTKHLEWLLPREMDVCYDCYMETHEMWKLFKNRGKKVKSVK